MVPARGVNPPPQSKRRRSGCGARVKKENMPASPEGPVGSEHMPCTELYQNPQQATTSPNLIRAGAVSGHPTLSRPSRRRRSTILRPVVLTAGQAQAKRLPNWVKRVSENKKRLDASQPGLKVGGRPAGWSERV